MLANMPIVNMLYYMDTDTHTLSHTAGLTVLGNELSEQFLCITQVIG